MFGKPTNMIKKEPNNVLRIKTITLRGRDAQVCCLRLPTYNIDNFHSA